MGTSSVASIIRNKKLSWDLNDLLKNLDPPKSDEIKKFPDDVLAISCCIQRLSRSLPGSARFNRSLDSSDNKEITDLDRKKAENIRKYYNDKLMMLTLQGRQLTKFRKDLQKFLNSDPTQVLESLCGIVYRLPYFYDYDKDIDDIFKSSYFKNTRPNDMAENLPRRLNFVKKVENQRKHFNNIEYWFQDESLNKVMFSIAANNPLLELLDRHIDTNGFNVKARYYVRKKDLNEYFVLEKWSFQ